MWVGKGTPNCSNYEYVVGFSRVSGSDHTTLGEHPLTTLKYPAAVGEARMLLLLHDDAFPGVRLSRSNSDPTLNAIHVCRSNGQTVYSTSNERRCSDERWLTEQLPEGGTGRGRRLDEPGRRKDRRTDSEDRSESRESRRRGLPRQSCCLSPLVRSYLNSIFNSQAKIYNLLDIPNKLCVSNQPVDVSACR